MVTIRSFRETDAPIVRDMMTRLAKQRKESSHDLVLKSEYERFFPAYMLGFLKNPDAVVKVAEEGGKVIGYAIAVRAKEPQYYRYHQVARLTDAFVQDAYRGKGVGRQLFDAIGEWAKQAQLQALEVDVFPEHKEETKALLGLGFFEYKVKLLRPLQEAKAQVPRKA